MVLNVIKVLRVIRVVSVASLRLYVRTKDKTETKKL